MKMLWTFLYKYIFIFLESGKKRGRQRNIDVRDISTYTLNRACNRGICSWLKLNLELFSLRADALSTEPKRVGLLYKYLYGYMLSLILGIYLGMQGLNHIAAACSDFKETDKLFYKVVVPFCTITSSDWEFHLFHFLTNTWLWSIFYFSYFIFIFKIRWFVFLSFWKFFIYPGQKSFIRYVICKYFLQVNALSYYALNSVL